MGKSSSISADVEYGKYRSGYGLPVGEGYLSGNGEEKSSGEVGKCIVAGSFFTSISVLIFIYRYRTPCSLYLPETFCELENQSFVEKMRFF